MRHLVAEHCSSQGGQHLRVELLAGTPFPGVPSFEGVSK